MTQAKSHAGLTTKNHLGAMYAQKPQMLSNVVHKMLSAAGVANLDTLLNSLPVKYVDSDDDFTWKLVGSTERNIPLAADATQVGDEILLTFGERYFSDVNVLVGEKNELYQFRVLDEPEAQGTNYVYRTQLMGADKAMPASTFMAGHRFSKDFSPVEDTMSIKGGDITFSSAIEMRNEFTTIRMEHKVPGNMLGRRVSSKIVGLDAKGDIKETEVWMQEVEWRFEEAFSREKARALMFSKSNRDENGTYHDIGKSGFVIKQGAGIREQMEVSNTTYYNAFSLDLLESLLQDLSEGKLGFSNRNFILRTGERGAIQFHKAVMGDFTGWQSASQNNPAVVKGASSELGSNAVQLAGYQFTEWLAPNGIKVSLEIDPMYDDKVRNKIYHPNGGVAESYRYDVIYVGSSEEPNIQKVMIKGQEEFRGYSAGFRNPFTGDINNQFMGTMEDSATYTRYATMGVAVIDPSRTIALIPSILA